jgi:hypothetical protein
MSDHGQGFPPGGATQRLAALFEENQGVPISRQQIQDLAGSQLDYMNRLRRNGGARDILDEKGIALLWGGRDRLVIELLGLGPITTNEFISYTPANQGELDLLRSNRHADLQAPWH